MSAAAAFPLFSGQPARAVDVSDGRQLRDAFSRFATGVVIVTTSFEGEKVGATISSFNTVSLAPPLISFCIARSSKALDIWNSTPGFAVNVLDSHQSELSTRFARSMGDKWTGVSTRRASTIEAPLIEGAVMWFECEVYARYDGGDHVILLGRVTAAEYGRTASPDPLLFFGGGYRHLAARKAEERSRDDAMWLHGW